MVRNWKTLLDNPEQLFPPLTAEQRVEAFTRLWSTVKFNFANFDLVPELNWDNVLSEYLPKVMREQSNNEYILLLQECVARLKDGHTKVESLWGNGLPAACPLLKIDSVEEKAVVIETADTNEIKASGIKVGDEITNIDECPVRDVLKKNIYPYISASTPQERDLKAYPELLRGGAESKVSLTIKTLKGEVRTISLTRKSNGLTLLARQAPRPDLEYRDLGGGLAYVALNGFANGEIVQAFNEKLKDINKTKGLLIDVRENGGGNSQYGDEIIACLIDKPIPATRWKTPQYRAAFRAWGNDEQWFNGEINMLKPKTANPFLGPVVVLTGPKTASAAEDFVVPLHAAGRATIVGQRSAGSTGQPLQFSFLDRKILGRVCTKRDQYPDGREFVGVGIIPDVEVGPTPADIASGRDAVLEKGLEVLRKKIK
jgi:C-terminal processing protease CtpA/Prc